MAFSLPARQAEPGQERTVEKDRKYEVLFPMIRNPPPPVLDSARVMAYAFVDDVPYRNWGALYVDGKLLEHVPRLAVCIGLGEDLGAMLFHCDSEWNVLGVSGTQTVAGTKEKAEGNYPGVSSRWIDMNTSVDAALEYCETQNGAAKCSFCRKRPFEVKSWIEGDGAAICGNCIEKFHGELQR